MEDNNLISNPNFCGHGCSLSAHGIDFEPELFLSQTTLAPDVILAYGKLGMPEELRSKVAEKDFEGTVLFDATVLIINISDSGVNKIQYTEAILFLKQYRDEVLRLSNFPNVEQVNLSCIAANGEICEESYPDELLELAGECGLTCLM